MGFDGFGEGAFRFFEKVAERPEWAYVASLEPEWERDVHVPMEQLLDILADEFGRDLYAYHLHRDPYLWSHQVGGLSVTDTIVYRVVLSYEGLRTEGGWVRSSPDQLRRYRRAVADDGPGEELAAVVDGLQRSGHEISGKVLRGRPRDWSADHPRIGLARHLTLTAVHDVPADQLEPGFACSQAVAGAWRAMRPLVEWLRDNVGARERR